MTARTIHLQLQFIVGTCLILVAAGCAPTRTSTRTRVRTIGQGNLDEWRKVVLSYDVIREREGTEPERKYEQVTLHIYPREHLYFERALKTVELKFGVPSGELRFEDAEARIDESRRKIWFVERDTGRIIATLDLETARTTGPDDEPPSWATPEGGAPLEQSSG